MDTSIFNTENLLTRHRLSPGQINALLGEGTVTEEVGEKLRAMEKTGEFVRITDAFESAKVPLIPLKGPVLSYRLYGDPANRRSGDLDFLVREHHIADALRLFHELGYQPEHGFWPPDKTRQRLLMRHTNEIAFYHPGKQSLVELHWRLLKRPLVSHARLEEMVWDNPATLTFADRTFATMPGELELLYLVIHGGTHWWRRLKWLVDIDVYLKTQTVDWNRFSRLAEELKAGRMVALANEMLSAYFPDTPLLPFTGKASPFMVRFSHRMIRSPHELTADFYSRIVGSVRFALVSFPGVGYKARTLRDYLFVTEFFGKNRLADSVPICYLYGPARLAVKRWSEGATKGLRD